MTRLTDEQIYVYCYYPNNRFAYVNEEYIEAEPEVHAISRWVVDKDDIPSNPQDYTFDGTTWALIDGVQQERDLAQMRAERNRLLADTDWTQFRDVQLVNDSDWTVYRQALRDITDTYNNINDVIWPTKPE